MHHLTDSPFRCQPSDAIELGELAPLDFPRFAYTMNEVRRSGEVISGPLAWTEETKPQIVRAFQVAHNWRDAHAWPMASVRGELIAHLRGCRIPGVTGARLKRMQAIRRKLKRIKLNLNQYQDLAGCRAVVPDISDVDRLVESILGRTRHGIRDKDDYISAPKPDGYRSRHLVVTYQGKGVTAVHDGRRVEIQIRTQLQHSWATAVEAVGLYLSTDLKSGSGSSAWLRLFSLISSEIADVERRPTPDGVPEKRQRLREIRDLSRELDAIQMLENLTSAFSATETFVKPKDKPKYFLIQFDPETHTANVQFYDKPLIATSSYDNAETYDALELQDQSNIVLIEIDKMETLRKAYPNYFGDVQMFKALLTRVVEGRSAVGYRVEPQESSPLKPRETPDFSWLRGRWKL